MVTVIKGMLIKCDPVMKQLLLHLDETLALGSKFVLANLDDCHLFVSQDVYESLKVRIDELYEKVYYNQTANQKSFD
ncbi:TFIIH subunit TTDA/Tfb5 [Trinorchestia longiramus]|nr:TFIIH subunit TTDA/Tfb5 [Trinorchestia longiramus]